MRFDPSADPWGTAMLACAVLAAFALVWAVVALAMRQPARGAGRTMSVALLGYLGSAVASTAIVVMTPPPPPPPAPSGPPVVIEAKVPADPDDDPNATALDAAKVQVRPAGIGAEAGAEPTDAKAEPTDAKAEPTDAKAEPTDAKAEPADAEAEPADAKAEPDPPTAEAAAPAVDLGPPTLAGREALRFVDEVSHDADKCADAKQVAAAARELPGALSDVPRPRLDKAANRLEGCRRKVVWARAYTIRRHRVEDREALALALPKRLREQGLAVLVSLRGAAHERIRIGGTGLDPTRAKALLDGGLRDELADAGFAEIVLADMKQAYKETPDVPTDAELAAAELAPMGLDRKIELPAP